MLKVLSETPKIELRLGDCLAEIKNIPDNTVSVTVTSPPYDNLRTYGGLTLFGERVWKCLIAELVRVTAPGGVVVWITSDATIAGSETGTSFKQTLWAKECGFRLHDTMIYAKNNPVPLTHNRYEQQFEYMFVWSKGRPRVFNPIMRNTTMPGKRHTGMFRQPDGGQVNRHGDYPTGKEAIKYNIWFYSVGYRNSTKDACAFTHPAIFPEGLAHDHIVSWSNEGDTVLDPFMGSGTTGKIAKILKRNFIGIEINPTYFSLAEKRITEALC